MTSPNPDDQWLRRVLDEAHARYERGKQQPPALAGPTAQDELVAVLSRAEEGDPDSARRAAELSEMLEDFDGAQRWWRRAAELGDPDAVDYVNQILAGDAPTEDDMRRLRPLPPQHDQQEGPST